MLDIKEIRKNLDFFKKKLLFRYNVLDLNKILILDKENRELINKKELLEQEKKIISKSNDKKNFKKSKELSNEINVIQKKLNISQKNFNAKFSGIPNIPLKDVPIGRDDSKNKVVSVNGLIPKFDFKPMSHDEIAKNLNMIDFDTATKTSGSRFVFLKNSLAKLERALSSFMLDTHTKKNGYMEISPPLIVNNQSMYGTGQLPKFENDQFELKLNDSVDRKFLIPTAEVILTNIVREKVLSLSELPIRLVASTSCFRKEAGSYGKDTKGMIRQHQFYKVEMVSVVEKQNCIEELERMTNCATDILDKLQLPYRKMILCCGDMGFSAEKTYDIEVWLPSENKYREISSCSSCATFQSQRMMTRYKDNNKKIVFPGTLNGSGLAIGRTLIAILENNQKKDGSIIVPEILRPYMNNLEIISAN